jgi:RNA polymerase sigma-70 factor (ECF subfamily)
MKAIAMLSIHPEHRPMPKDERHDEGVELLARYRRIGSPSSLEDLLRAHADAAFRLAKRITGNSADAEDVVQIAFLSVSAEAANFRGESSVRSWLLGIVFNAATKFVRGRQRRVAHERVGGQPAVRHSNPSDDAAEAVREAVEHLPEHERLPLSLHYLEALSLKDVASVLGVREGTVRVRLHRALERVRAQVSRLGYPITAAAMLAILSESVMEAAPASLLGSLSGISVAKPVIAASAASAKLAGAGAAALGVKVAIAASAAALIAFGATGVAMRGSNHANTPVEYEQVREEEVAPAITPPFMSFDFEDGVLPESWIKGHIEAGLPRPQNYYCLASPPPESRGGGLTREVVFAQKGDGIFVYTPEIEVRYEFWASGSVFQSVLSVWNGTQERSFMIPLPLETEKTWHSRTVRLADLRADGDPDVRMQPGDRIFGIGIGCGVAEESSFYVDNVELAHSVPSSLSPSSK